MSAMTHQYVPLLDLKKPSSTHPSLPNSNRNISLPPSSATINSTPFVPTHSVQIQTPGIGCLRIPLPPSDLQTPILSPSGIPIYVSVRNSRWKGNCTLQRVTNDGKMMEDVAKTEYRFGCFRDPVVWLGCGVEATEQVVLRAKGLWMRSVTFESPKHGRFEWRYATKLELATAGTHVDSLLTLSKLPSAGTEAPKLKIAQLTRGEGTRTPWTKKSSAGNGGLLEMDLSGLGGKRDEVDEVVVVATCLVMLKKEVDRRRKVQGLVIAGDGA